MKNCSKEPPTKNLYFEDVLDLLEVPEISDGGPYGWGHLYSTVFCLRLPKIFNTWGVN